MDIEHAQVNFLNNKNQKIAKFTIDDGEYLLENIQKIFPLLSADEILKLYKTEFVDLVVKKMESIGISVDIKLSKSNNPPNIAKIYGGTYYEGSPSEDIVFDMFPKNLEKTVEMYLLQSIIDFLYILENRFSSWKTIIKDIPCGNYFVSINRSIGINEDNTHFVKYSLLPNVDEDIIQLCATLFMDMNISIKEQLLSLGVNEGYISELSLIGSSEIISYMPSSNIETECELCKKDAEICKLIENYFQNLHKRADYMNLLLKHRYSIFGDCIEDVTVFTNIEVNPDYFLIDLKFGLSGSIDEELLPSISKVTREEVLNIYESVFDCEFPEILIEEKIPTENILKFSCNIREKIDLFISKLESLNNSRF